MPRIRAMSDLNSRDLRHKFFNYTCASLEPNNFVFYYCVQQYNAAPNKRKAIFIFDTFLKEILTSQGSKDIGFDDSADDSYKLLRQVNVYDAGNYAGQITRIGTAVGNIKKVKKWTGKLLHRELVAEYGRPRAGLFGEAQTQIEALMRENWFKDFDTTSNPVVPGMFPAQIQVASRTLTELGFDPDAMGVY